MRNENGFVKIVYSKPSLPGDDALQILVVLDRNIRAPLNTDALKKNAQEAQIGAVAFVDLPAMAVTGYIAITCNH